MTQETIKRLDDFFAKNPIAKGTPCTDKEIASAQQELGIEFDKDYVFFLLRYGGSLIKAKEVCGFTNSELMGDDNMVDLTKVYREQENSQADWLVIGTDYAGNPVAIDGKGNVVLDDHDFGEIREIADSFEAYAIKSLNE